MKGMNVVSISELPDEFKHLADEDDILFAMSGTEKMIKDFEGFVKSNFPHIETEVHSKDDVYVIVGKKGEGFVL